MKKIEFYTGEYYILEFIMNKQLENKNEKFIKTSQDEMVSKLGFGKHRVNRCIKLLIENGYLKKEKPQGKGKYQITTKGKKLFNGIQ